MPSSGDREASQSPLGERLQLTAASLDQRLRYLRFESNDLANLAHIHAAIEGDVEAIVGEFYEHLDRFESLRPFLTEAATRTRLRAMLREYLLTLGSGIDSLDYAERRLRVGVVHEGIGLALQWYLGAHTFLFAAIASRLRPRPGKHLTDLVSTLHKVLTFDAELVVETYHRASVDRVEALLHELERAQQRLRESSRIDDLTGALNRGAALESLETELHRALRYRQPFSLLVLDVDRFKAINDENGHPFGDYVLARVVTLCRKVLRPWDVIGRLGGDELVVGLLACAATEAERIAERIRLEVTKAAYEKGGRTATVTLSIGVATAGAGTRTLPALLESSDRALYRAKQCGRNRVCSAPARQAPDGAQSGPSLGEQP